MHYDRIGRGLNAGLLSMDHVCVERLVQVDPVSYDGVGGGRNASRSCR